MSFIDFFSEKSELYAAARPTYPPELFAKIAELSPAHKHVWDCATGNGQAAIGLAKHFDFVDATDASAAQISNAVAHERVRYSVQPADQTDFAPASFDTVCVAQALHWFAHEKFFVEVQRVLKPDGIFAAWTYDRLTLSPEIDRVLKETIYDVIAPYWARENTLAWNGYAGVPMPFARIEAVPPPMGFDVNLHQMLAHIHTWSATRRCMSAIGTGFFERAGERLDAVWGDPETVRMVSMRLQWVLGRHVPAT